MIKKNLFISSSFILIIFLLDRVSKTYVIYLNDKYRDTENNRIARKIFDLAGIEYRKLVPEKEVLASLNDHFQKLFHEA